MLEVIPEHCEHTWFIVDIKFTNPAGLILRCVKCGARYITDDEDMFDDPPEEDLVYGKELLQ